MSGIDFRFCDCVHPSLSGRDGRKNVAPKLFLAARVTSWDMIAYVWHSHSSRPFSSWLDTKWWYEWNGKGLMWEPFGDGSFPINFRSYAVPRREKANEMSVYSWKLTTENRFRCIHFPHRFSFGLLESKFNIFTVLIKSPLQSFQHVGKFLFSPFPSWHSWGNRDSCVGLNVKVGYEWESPRKESG